MFKHNNKKALVGTTLALIAATIVVVLILAVFLSLSNLAFKFKFRKQGEMSKFLQEEESLISLKNFLDSEIEIGINGKNEGIDMDYLIRLYAVDNSYKKDLEVQSKKILENFEGCYFLSIYNLKIGNSRFSSDAYILKLPSSPEKSIEVSLAINDKCIEEKNEK